MNICSFLERDINGKELTPVEKIGNWYVKREDKYQCYGLNGGKLRAAKVFIEKHADGLKGLVTAGASVSPQTLIVAKIAESLGIDCRIHIPKTLRLGREVYEAGKIATLIGHKPGYNSVICARAKKDAEKHKYLYIPFGMDFIEAIEETAYQTYNVPEHIKTIVCPVGSAMSLIGIKMGLLNQERKIKVIGIVTGANPIRRIKKYAPSLKFTLFYSNYNYHQPINEKIGELDLDEIYEAKAWNYVKNMSFDSPLFWIVGKRKYNGFIYLEKNFWIEKNNYWLGGEVK